MPQYQLGADGMPRRIATYPASTGWADLNLVSTVGAVVLLLGTLPFLVAFVLALRAPRTRDRRPVGGQLARVGDDVAAAPPQLRIPAADPIRATGLRRADGGRGNDRRRRADDDGRCAPDDGLAGAPGRAAP